MPLQCVYSDCVRLPLFIPLFTKGLHNLVERFRHDIQVSSMNANLSMEMEWVPIESEADLPDEDTTVLVHHPDYETVRLGFHDGKQWRSEDGYDLDPEPTHWMEQPPRPSDD